MTILELARAAATRCPGCGDPVVLCTDALICWDCESRALPPRAPAAARPAQATARARPVASVPDAIRELFDEGAGPVPARSRRACGGRGR